MKRIVFIISILSITTVAFGQVKVKSNRNLSITSETTNEADASLYIKRKNGSGATYGVYSRVDQYNQHSNYDCIGVYGYVYNQSNYGYRVRYVGVLGQARNYCNIRQYGIGVAGIATTTGGQVGVFGGINSLPASLPSGTLYAGYFTGKVQVNGNLTTTTLTQTSDERLKQNIRSIDTNVTNNLMQLKPVLYNYKQIEKEDMLRSTLGKDSVVVSKRYDEKSQEFQKKHYGFLAQELQKVYPDLVYEGGDGYLEINYIAMIPLLVSSIQELNQKIYSLEKELNSAAIRKNVPSKTSQQGTETEQETTDESEALLFQNTPNPFSENTEIAFYLPQSLTNAMLCIFDMNGKQLLQNTIAERGNSVFVVNGSQYEAGMYLYSLIADNQLIDTKRMILTK